MNDAATRAVSALANDHVFFDARKALFAAGQVDVLACVHLAQRLVSDALLAQDPDCELARLARADIVETLLARHACKAAQACSTYASLSLASREDWMLAVLVPELVEWLAARPLDKAGRERLERAAKRVAY